MATPKEWKQFLDLYKSIRASTLALYTTQADEVTDFIRQTPSVVWTNNALAKDRLARLDLTLTKLDEQMKIERLSNVNRVATLSNLQTAEFLASKKIKINIADLGVQYTNLLDMPSKQAKYALSPSIWKDNNRADLYRLIIDNVKNRKDEDLYKKLDGYLKTPKKAKYYQVDRLINSETNNYFQKSARDSGIIANQRMREIGQMIVMKRSLSPAHPRPDICDALVGYYVPENLPANPHPFCMCTVQRSLYNSSIQLNQTVSYKNGVYTSDKWGVNVYNMDVFI